MVQYFKGPKKRKQRNIINNKEVVATSSKQYENDNRQQHIIYGKPSNSTLATHVKQIPSPTGYIPEINIYFLNYAIIFCSSFVKKYENVNASSL